MTIEVGDPIPSATLHVLVDNSVQERSTDELFAGKKVVLFAVPGAFTPGCSNTHLPGYVVNADKIKARGVDSILCMSVNDAFVMGAWGKAQNASELVMVADGNGELTRKLGLEMDGSSYGLGTRCQRFAAIVNDGVIEHLALEPTGGITESSAEAILAKL